MGAPAGNWELCGESWGSWRLSGSVITGMGAAGDGWEL